MLSCVLNVQAYTRKPFMNRSFLIFFSPILLLFYFLNTIYTSSKALINSELSTRRGCFSSMHHCCLYCMHLFKMNWKPKKEDFIFLLLFDYVSCATCSLIFEFFTLFTAHIKRCIKFIIFLQFLFHLGWSASYIL